MKSVNSIGGKKENNLDNEIKPEIVNQVVTVDNGSH